MPVYLLNEELIFPPAEEAEDGVIAVGGDLSPERILLAYRCGIFPWFSEVEPIMWWSPDPRFILKTDELHIPKSMRRLLNASPYSITYDTNFSYVIRKCADIHRPGEYGTWITEDMIVSLCELHEMGYAHSVEVWKNDHMVGGLYGVSLGKCFFAESMFHEQAGASKYALIKLTEMLREKGFHFIDAQLHSAHVEGLGAKNIRRKEFLLLLENALQGEDWVGKWNMEG